ncbi:hypothetical protein TNIN_141741 [Trichonephila inaurata madagascariensis]|uniref:Uncharacterized protein n=1 Tax=Trichonephila inaurata madagascariensis TaxID=2747483 RepID=A0A8X6M7T9_9ARAC|nr:hypothetical protein TNIN_26411 [Trichonephila inaurata madagascariensis]GFS50473.1 hypothetical protein TNIN_141741 [Trichonephila inaurata madagascariensis]
MYFWSDAFQRDFAETHRMASSLVFVDNYSVVRMSSIVDTISKQKYKIALTKSNHFLLKQRGNVTSVSLSYLELQTYVSTFLRFDTTGFCKQRMPKILRTHLLVNVLTMHLTA